MSRASPAAAFGPGMALDVLPGCAGLAVAADAAAGDDGGFDGVSEAELVGVLGAWDRVEAHAAARKLAAVAELVRRNPAPERTGVHRRSGRVRAGRVPRPGRQPDRPGPDPRHAGCPARWRRWRTGRSPGTRPRSSPAPPRCWTMPRPGRRAEGPGPGGAADPGGLRAAIARAVMEVAPKKAKERREAAAKDARVERWAEDSGNAALMGCELPPAEVLAADQRITAWARELRRAGLEGDMDLLRARAFLDLLLGKDSRPRRDASGGGDGTGPGPGGPGPGTAPPSAGRSRRVRRAGHPDRPAGHPGRPGRPARRDRRDRPGRPVAGSGPGRRGRGRTRRRHGA